MFGVVHACRGTLDDELFAQWQAHLCGLCLQLRDSRGQLSRALTNTDAIALSVLTEAQQSSPAGRRTAGPCPLRGMRTAQVVRPGSAATRLGAAASLTLAAAKAQDLRAERVHHLGLPTLRTRAGSALAEPLRRRALADAPMARVMHATRALDGLARQGAVEAAVRPGDDLLAVTAPTAQATAEIFAASATVAGRPENELLLRELGSDFGTLAHLLDAVTDLPADRRNGSFNPIAATGAPLAQVREHCRRLVRRIRVSFDQLALTDGRLARALLVDGTHAALHRAFDPPAGTTPPPPNWPGVPTQVPDKPAPDSPQGPQSPPPPEPPRPPFWPNVLPWIGVYCTGYACCAAHENPCTGRQHSAGCSGCDGSCCDCGDCCDCDCGDGCCCDCGCN
ncbi:MAG: DUF5685 family protein [Nakamurella multipartita]